jgi:hypothetical protein
MTRIGADGNELAIVMQDLVGGTVGHVQLLASSEMEISKIKPDNSFN